MLAGMRAIAVAVAMVSASCAAVAQTVPSASQLVPPSDQPGRERERFERPPVPLAQPGGPAIAVPGIEAPPGAARDHARHPANSHHRRDGLHLRAVARALCRPHRPEGHAAGRSTISPGASPPNTAATATCSRAPSCRRRTSIPTAPSSASEVVEGYIEKVEWPAKLARYRDFFSDYAAKITAERPVNIRTIERYLLLAGDLPGLKFKNSLKPLDHQAGRLDPGGRGDREAARLSSAGSTIAAPGRAARCSFSAPPPSTICCTCTRLST